MASTTLIETIVSGALTGGAGAATTLLAFFRDVRKRLETIEKVVGGPGSAVEPKTGFHFVLSQVDDTIKRLDEAVRKLRRDIDGWEDDPPEWAVRLVNRRATASFTSETMQEEIAQKFRLMERRLNQLEEDLDRLLKEDSNYVERSLYDLDSRKRNEELRKIQDNLNTANGFLRGVMTALGYLEGSTPPPPPNPPPVLPPRKR
jgi:chromosome segregation ATPase